MQNIGAVTTNLLRIPLFILHVECFGNVTQTQTKTNNYWADRVSGTAAGALEEGGRAGALEDFWIRERFAGGSPGGGWGAMSSSITAGLTITGT